MILGALFQQGLPRLRLLRLLLLEHSHPKRQPEA